jgi:hypothetical protein
LQRLGQTGVKRIQAAAAKDQSPALANVGTGGNGTDQALLSYLMGSG